MAAFVIGDTMERRQEPSLVLASSLPPGGMDASSYSGAIALGSSGIVATSAVSIASANLIPTTTAFTSPNPTTVTAPPSEATAASSATPSSAPASSGLATTTLIAILVPVCVLLAAIPTIAYLCYLRRRDRRNREMEAEIMRGRLAPSGASAHTSEGLLMRRSMSASSQRETKYPSGSTEDLDLTVMEKGQRQPEIRDSASIFAPPQHGLSRRGAPGSIDATRKPGVPVAPLASQSPTLPPLDFGKDANEKDPFNMSSTTSSPPKPTVPATLPSFAPAQPRRAPNPALAPALGNTRSNTSSPVPNQAAQSPAIASSKASPNVAAMDNPNWPLPAPSRDSSSTYSSTNTMPLAPAVNKPLPSGLSREVSPGRAPVARNPSTRTQQPGPRESSIAYGMPPIPPSPEAQAGFGDRRSGASRKRDSDAVSELSYSMSVRGKRDTRRDTDAISVISAMSDKDR